MIDFINFLKYENLNKEKYLADELFNIGDKVINKEDKIGTIIRKGKPNYVICLDENNNVFREWIDNIKIYKDKNFFTNKNLKDPDRINNWINIYRNNNNKRNSIMLNIEASSILMNLTPEGANRVGYVVERALYNYKTYDDMINYIEENLLSSELIEAAKQYINIQLDEKNPCWSGYHPKEDAPFKKMKKGGKKVTVPNCVPESLEPDDQTQLNFNTDSYPDYKLGTSSKKRKGVKVKKEFYNWRADLSSVLTEEKVVGNVILNPDKDKESSDKDKEKCPKCGKAMKEDHTCPDDSCQKVKEEEYQYILDYVISEGYASDEDEALLVVENLYDDELEMLDEAAKEFFGRLGKMAMDKAKKDIETTRQAIGRVVSQRAKPSTPPSQPQQPKPASSTSSTQQPKATSPQPQTQQKTASQSQPAQPKPSTPPSQPQQPKATSSTAPTQPKPAVPSSPVPSVQKKTTSSSSTGSVRKALKGALKRAAVAARRAYRKAKPVVKKAIGRTSRGISNVAGKIASRLGEDQQLNIIDYLMENEYAETFIEAYDLMEELDDNAIFYILDERKMTAAEKAKEERIGKKTKSAKTAMKKEYGSEKGEKVYYGWKRKQAMKEDLEELDEAEGGSALIYGVFDRRKGVWIQKGMTKVSADQLAGRLRARPNINWGDIRVLKVVKK